MHSVQEKVNSQWVQPGPLDIGCMTVFIRRPYGLFSFLILGAGVCGARWHKTHTFTSIQATLKLNINRLGWPVTTWVGTGQERERERGRWSLCWVEQVWAPTRNSLIVNMEGVQVNIKYWPAKTGVALLWGWLGLVTLSPRPPGLGRFTVLCYAILWTIVPPCGVTVKLQ